jgi:GTP-binding protein LepA
MVKVVLITPEAYYGSMIEVIKLKRCEDVNIVHLENNIISITSVMPWQEVVCDMHDMVKNKSSGYANFNYTEHGYKAARLSKVEIAVNGNKSLLL